MLQLQDFHLRTVMLTTRLLLNIIRITINAYNFSNSMEENLYSEFDSSSASLEQEPATGSYPKSDKSCPQRHTRFL
jgi:hypothetical protein